jgi:integrase
LVFFRDQADQRKASKSNHENWLCVYQHLVKFTEGRCTFGMINEGFIKEFRDYLLFRTGLARNSAQGYFAKFKAAIRIAFENNHLSENHAERVRGIKPAETQREFLTIEELQTLADTECEIPVLKHAALFSALTGLRFSDVAKLLWSEVQHSELEGHFIRFKQQKTKGVETLPISDQAYSLLGESGQPGERVFPDLNYSQRLNRKLSDWMKRAGITKRITFHCFRHSFATIQLSLGTDIYTISKLLGHRELKTTQIYTKIIDKTKREAVNRIRLEL